MEMINIGEYSKVDLNEIAIKPSKMKGNITYKIPPIVIAIFRKGFGLFLKSSINGTKKNNKREIT